ncbi:MAG TPA: DUF4886 domain-containing protein [Planctomycetota bacterium]|nr:DUF4886 domain-containing protein [Planctomycetota bacterium]
MNRLLILATLVCSVPVLHAADVAVYHVGNSLSQDMWYAFPPLAAQFVKTHGGTSYEWGFHFRPSTGISYIVHHPEADGTKSQVGPWTSALSERHWDFVTMQPYYATAGEPSTLASDTAAMQTVIRETRKNPANAGTRFFIYAAWPSVNAGDPGSYAKSYLILTRNAADQTSSLARTYIADLCAAMSATESDIAIIPVGEVLYVIDQHMQAGKVPGFTSIIQLHRDVHHLNGLGHQVAAWTTYAVLFKQSPVGLPFQDLKGVVVAPFTDPAAKDIQPEAIALLQGLIWDVVGPAVNGKKTKDKTKRP